MYTEYPVNVFFFADSFIFFAELFWSLKHFGHFSHSSMEIRRNSIH